MYQWTDDEVEAILGLVVRCVNCAEEPSDALALMLAELGKVLRADHWRFETRPSHAHASNAPIFVQHSFQASLHSSDTTYFCLTTDWGAQDALPGDIAPAISQAVSQAIAAGTVEVCSCLGPDQLHPSITHRWNSGRHEISELRYVRSPGQPPFDERDQAILKVVTHQLDTVCVGRPPIPSSIAQASIAQSLIAQGSSVLAPSVHLRTQPLADLSKRQREVLELLLLGKNSKQIASELRLSVHTVNDYIKAIYRRYDVSSRAELLAAVHIGATA